MPRRTAKSRRPSRPSVSQSGAKKKRLSRGLVRYKTALRNCSSVSGKKSRKSAETREPWLRSCQNLIREFRTLVKWSTLDEAMERSHAGIANLYAEVAAYALANCPAWEYFIKHGSLPKIGAVQYDRSHALLTGLPPRVKTASPALACLYVNEKLPGKKNQFLRARDPKTLSAVLHANLWPIESPPTCFEEWEARAKCIERVQWCLSKMPTHLAIGGMRTIELSISNTRMYGRCLLMHVHCLIELGGLKPIDKKRCLLKLKQLWEKSRDACRDESGLDTIAFSQARLVTPGTVATMCRYCLGVQKRHGSVTTKMLKDFLSGPSVTPSVLRALLADVTYPLREPGVFFGLWNLRGRAALVKQPRLRRNVPRAVASLVPRQRYP